MDLQTLLRLSGLFDPNQQSPNSGIINQQIMPSQQDQPIGADEMGPPINPALNQQPAMAPQNFMAPSNPVEMGAAGVPPEDDTQYNPRHNISDMYQRGLEGGPPADEPVSKWRRLAGIVSGGLMAGTTGDVAGGVKLGQSVVQDPNDRAKRTYKERMDELGRGTAEEDKFNTNERIRTYNAQTNDIKQQQLGINQQKADAITQNAETKELAENQKHESAKLKQTNIIAMADAKLKFAYDKLQINHNDEQAKLEFKRAELESKEARQEVQRIDLEFKQGQLERRTTSMEERNKVLNQNVGGSKTTTNTLYDANGKVKETGVKRVGPTGNSVITDPTTGHSYDTSTWSDADKAAAKAKGWK